MHQIEHEVILLEGKTNHLSEKGKRRKKFQGNGNERKILKVF
jgi:hypothetical protein